MSSFFRLERVHENQLATGRDYYLDIVEQRIHGVLIDGVFSKEQAAAWVGSLESDDSHFRKHRLAQTFEGWCYGLGLDRCAGDLERYCEEADALGNSFEALSAQTGLSLDKALWNVMERLGGGMPVHSPTYRETRSYMRMNLRRFPETGGLPPHLGLEQQQRDPYKQLNDQINHLTQVSYFIVLQAPEEGGDMLIYDFHWDQITTEHFVDGYTNLIPFLEGVDTFRIRPTVGSLLVFDGGRIAHEVTSVGGAIDRWTMGGFMAQKVDLNGYLIWT